jgi:cytosol alanyl aminopeptidase
MTSRQPLRRFALAAATAAVLAAFSVTNGDDSVRAATTAAFSQSEAPAGQLGDAVTPTHYEIELSIDPLQDRFSGKVAIDITLNRPQAAIWLHGRDLDVIEAYLTYGQGNRVDADYAERLGTGVALVSFSHEVPAGSARLHFRYNAAFNKSTNALFKMERSGSHYAATQFQPIAARQVFPGFDEPVFKVPFDLAVVARDGDVVITTTPEVSTEDLGNGSVRHKFQRTRPLPTYLLAFAVGPYDVVDHGMIPANSVRTRELALRGIAAKGLGKQMKYALQHTGGLLSILEKYFGSPYPYEKLDLIAVPESFGGAMENVGAITYDEYLLIMDENSPLTQRRAYTFVHAHELAHMWFGNLVTPKWWNDIWLNEAFASWMMFKAAQTYWAEGEFDRETVKTALGAMANDSLAAAREIREQIDSNEKIAGTFDVITYQKGGGVLAMLERYVGESQFQAGVRLHMQRHADGTATAEDFIASIAEGSDRREIAGAFRTFIEQPGVPLVSVTLDCTEHGKPRLDVTQTRYAPLGSSIEAAGSRWQIPVCVAYDTDGTRTSTCTLLSEAARTIDLEASRCPTALHPNADGTGYYRFSMDAGGWTSLIAAAPVMGAAEALVLADSLDAAFRAGKVSADTYVAGMATLVHHETWDVADAATRRLEAIVNILDVSELPVAEAAFRAIAEPRFARLATADDAGSQLLRQRLQRFLIVVAKDKAMRAPLAKQAASVIGLDGEPDQSAAPAGEFETVFSVGVQDLGEDFFDRLLDQAAASEDPAFRNAAFGALARAEGPVLVQKLQDAVLAGRFRGTEMLGIVARQLNRVATTESTYAWLRKNDEAIIGMIPETFRSAAVPELGGAFCTEQRAGDWQQFVTAHAGQLPGYERGLAQAVERIRLCTALKSAQAEQLVGAFAKYNR